MYLILLIVFGISATAFAGTIPEDKQQLLLSVLTPNYGLYFDTRLKALSGTQLRTYADSDEDFAKTLRKLGPTLKFFHPGDYTYLGRKDREEITNLLQNSPNLDSLVHRARMLQSFVDPAAYNIALKKAALLRKDTTELWYPPLWQINSRSFFTEETITHASIDQTRTNVPNMENSRFSTGTSTDPEFRLAWFREDIRLNEMHAKVGSIHRDLYKNLVDIAHFISQVIARYDTERFAVGLPRVAGLTWNGIQNEPIPEGYDPHLSTLLGQKAFSPRPANMKIQSDLRDPDNPVSIGLSAYLAQKIQDDIISGFITKENGEQEPMTKEILDQVLMGKYEANKRVYTEQGLHDIVHQMLSVITDPDGRYRQEIGILGAQETAMRDPLFYRYHRLIYNFYDTYNMMLPVYSKSDFEFPGIRVDDVKVKTIGSQDDVLETFMESAEETILLDTSVKISHSKDTERPLKIPYERLNHDDFEYFINVHNSNPSEDGVKAVVRIFIAPHNDETKTPFRSLNDQRRFFIEMDKFVTTLKKGDNIIKRSSVLSSVSFPSVDTYEEWRAFVNTHGLRHDRLTGCGWPANLLLPRGTAEGMDFDLFVMLTDWTKDRAEDVDPDTIPNLDFGSSLCGVKGAPYPDNKSRSFPFDRKFESHSVLEDFAGNYENVFVNNLKIIRKR